MLVPSCHELPPSSEAEDAPQEAESVESDKTGPLEPAPSRVTIGIKADEPDRWLFVEGVKEDEPGGWATGSFDNGRNMLEIQTHDVQAFAVDVGRIQIQWDRLVILSIDGLRSELRRRDYTLLHFALDKHGQWVVIEP